MTWWHEEHTWRSGRWLLALRDDELADIALDGRTVLRSIRAVVRDQDWNTATLKVEAVDDSRPGQLTLRLHSEGFGANLRGTLTVAAETDALNVELELCALDEFWTNRTGLVVLHPPHVAGTSLRVTHWDDTVEETAFPQQIRPHQPAFDIAGLSWRDAGADIRLRFGGDVFEMEDQRNWSDASFKTYSRPLALPFPYRLPAGGIVAQTLHVHVHEDGPAPRTSERDPRIAVHAGGTFPDVLLGSSTAPDPAPEAPPVGAGRLVELDLASPAWRAALVRARRAGMPLDVRLVLDDADEHALDAAAEALRDVEIMRISAFPPTGPSRHVSDVATITALRRALSRAGVDAPIAGGARSHFTELNRERHRVPDDVEGIVFGITPLFHSHGTEQLVESLPIQRLIATQAVSTSQLPVHIGPVTLRPHFNDVATTPAPQTPYTDLRAGYGPQLLDGDDPRQSADELAAWTIASAAALAVPGVASLTYFEEWGPRGIRSSDGTALPVAAAIDALADLRGAGLLHGNSPDGLVWAVGAARSGAETVLIANLDRAPRIVTVTSRSGERTVTVGAGAWVRMGGREE